VTGRGWFLGVTALLTVAHPLLPADLRSVNVGAVLSDGRLTADELIGRADQAMYAAKELTRVPA
jgi:GGDEF domain-containing protein